MVKPILFSRREVATHGARPERDLAFRRVRRGVWAPPPAPTEDRFARDRARYLELVHAAHRSMRGAHVFSHESAAVLLGLPSLAAWPDAVHVIEERRSGGRTQRDVVHHCIGLEHVRPVVVDGVVLTSPARTVFDLALSRPFDDALVVADAALRLFPDVEAELRSPADAYGHGRGWQKVQRVLEFMDGRSGSVGESLSRIRIAEGGFIRPELQVRVVTEGRLERGDFGWEEVLGLGEFDGVAKYRLDRYRKGGSIEDVVLREKERENRIRRQRPRFARWDWADLHQGRLERILLAAGIPKRKR